MILFVLLHWKADCIIPIGLAHSPAGHHNDLVGINMAGLMELGSPDGDVLEANPYLSSGSTSFKYLYAVALYPNFDLSLYYYGTDVESTSIFHGKYPSSELLIKILFGS